jgi:hypothetical protein
MLELSIRDPLEKFLCPHIEKSSASIKYSERFVKSPIRVGKENGNSILLCGNRKSYFPFQCFVGPDWPMLVYVYGLILTTNLVVLPFISQLGIAVTIIGIVGFLSLLFFYSAVSCSDPGIIYDESRISSSDSQPDEERVAIILQADLENQLPSEPELKNISTNEEIKVSENETPTNTSIPNTSNTTETILCGQCEIQRPYTSRHCSYCGVCIDKLDHHCPCKFILYFVAHDLLINIFIIVDF